jgi:hypothetical protein
VSQGIPAKWETLEQTPLKFARDGSANWFEMYHEEGLAVDRWGRIVEHAVAGKDPDRLIFSASAVRAASDGGIIMHSHPRPGTSFSLADLAAITLNPDGHGIVLAVTTMHPVGGIMRHVRYTIDARECVQPLPAHQQIGEWWDQEFDAAGVELYLAHARVIEVEEAYALHMHRVVERISLRLRVVYRREIVR